MNYLRKEFERLAESRGWDVSRDNGDNYIYTIPRGAFDAWCHLIDLAVARAETNPPAPHSGVSPPDCIKRGSEADDPHYDAGADVAHLLGERNRLSLDNSALKVELDAVKADLKAAQDANATYLAELLALKTEKGYTVGGRHVFNVKDNWCEIQVASDLSLLDQFKNDYSAKVKLPSVTFVDTAPPSGKVNKIEEFVARKATSPEGKKYGVAVVTYFERGLGAKAIAQNLCRDYRMERPPVTMVRELMNELECY